MLTKVAIIGRPNVGKSTLFNKIIDSKRALVKNQPGTTRDIKISNATWLGKQFEIIDTGGLSKTDDLFSQEIERKILNLLTEVDALIVIVDGKFGIHPEDKYVVRLAKELSSKIFFVINKVDSYKESESIKTDFYELNDVWLSASFENKVGITDILDWIATKVCTKDSFLKSSSYDEHMKTLTIIGKPNAGKSTLCNFINGYDRMIVTDIPGTTTDSVDSIVEFENKKYKLVDTAGIRRRAKRKTGLEKLSSIQSEKSIERADIILLLLDCMEGIGHQEARLVSNVLSLHKPVILVVNKSDIGKDKFEDFRKTFRQKAKDVFAFFEDIPLVFISAKNGSGVKNLFKTVEIIWDKLNHKVSTSKLNDFFLSLDKKQGILGGRVKLYYVVQTKQVPPTFIAFTNNSKPLLKRYRRFLVKEIKKKWKLSGIPIRIFTRKK